MRRIPMANLVVWILCFAELAFAIPKDNEVTIAWEEGLKPPYLMLNSSGKPSGIAVDALTEILKRNNLVPIHIVIPWKRCLLQIENKEIDLVPNSSFKEERALFSLYTSALYKTQMTIFYLKDQFPTPPKINSVADLKPYRLGGILGFNYDHLGKSITIDDGAGDRISLMQKLQYGRIDLAEDQLEVMLYLQKTGKLSLKNIGWVSDPVVPMKEFFILAARTEKGEKLRLIINKGIEEIYRDGTMKKITAKYLGKPMT